MKNRSYYCALISDFLNESSFSILGTLTKNDEFSSLEKNQTNAWEGQIEFLKKALPKVLFDEKSMLFFEFQIPRMGKRADVILIIKSTLFILEFKVGDEHFTKAAKEQVIDYSLDLKNFHEGSHDINIVPIVVATQAGMNYASNITLDLAAALNSTNALLSNGNDLSSILSAVLNNDLCKGNIIDPMEWVNSTYKPTPTIIQAAKALYRGHHVADISRSDAGAINLSLTTKQINEIIDHSKHNSEKSICFLTGVPGAGKTLAGLNIAIERNKIDRGEHSVFLSGNGPLVAVLQESLARDSYSRDDIKKADATRKAKSFIQNIHHFRDEYIPKDRTPIEKVVVFDESQRAWDKTQLRSFMSRKKGISDFDMSEPEFLIDVMDRQQDWCTIVCLIGGGQEINSGEAGVNEWVSALKSKYSNWKVYYSDRITDEPTYLSEPSLLEWIDQNGICKKDLHLAVSVRSFRSENTSNLVEKILNGDSLEVKNTYINDVKANYKIFITRDFIKAKNYLKETAKGTEQYGVIASSGALRLKAVGINAKSEIKPENWFLNDSQDVRSSYFCEDVATEFDIQGLEIDYTCLAWDINMYYDSASNTWKYQNFVGNRWNNMNSTKKKYLSNAYRVLLTRARQGMVIYIPYGNNEDKTRPEKLYNDTWEYFKACGFDVL